jgi:ribosomal protein S14
MTDAERKRRPCAACGKPVGLATIVAGGDYPNASLCLECGTRRTVEEVFEMIQKRRATES